MTWSETAVLGVSVAVLIASCCLDMTVAIGCCGPGPPPVFALEMPPLPPSMKLGDISSEYKCRAVKDIGSLGPNYAQSTGSTPEQQVPTPPVTRSDQVVAIATEHAPDPQSVKSRDSNRPKGKIANASSGHNVLVLGSVTTPSFEFEDSVTATTISVDGSALSAGTIAGMTVAMVLIVIIIILVVLHVKNRYLKYQIEPESGEHSNIASYLYNNKLRTWFKQRHSTQQKTTSVPPVASRRTLVKADNGSRASLSSSDTGYCEEVLDNQDNLKLENENTLPREHRNRHSFRDSDGEPEPRSSRRSGSRSSGRQGGPCTNRPLAVQPAAQELRETTPDIIASAKEHQPPRPRGWNLLSGFSLPLPRPTNPPFDPQVSQAGHSGNIDRASSPAGTSTSASEGEGLGNTLMKTLSGVSGWLSNHLIGHSPREVPSPEPNKPPEENVQLMVITKAGGTQRVRKKKRKNSDSSSGPADV